VTGAVSRSLASNSSPSLLLLPDLPGVSPMPSKSSRSVPFSQSSRSVVPSSALSMPAGASSPPSVPDSAARSVSR